MRARSRKRDRFNGLCHLTDVGETRKQELGDLQVASVMAHSGEFPLSAYSLKSYRLHYTEVFEGVMVRAKKWQKRL